MQYDSTGLLVKSLTVIIEPLLELSLIHFISFSFYGLTDNHTFYFPPQKYVKCIFSYM